MSRWAQDAARTESYVVGTIDHQHILRLLWVELIGRVEPCWIINKLYQLLVLSFAEMEQIKAWRTQKERAEALMGAMLRRSLRDYITFAELLSETEGLHDLGRRLLGTGDNMHTDSVVLATCMMHIHRAPCP